ncbi:DUF6412 domain-containing protein [Jidongwangia harbinensis]|uniref:DUF6412 domain-containing protein n=1 Tax=Jidongwangia harbinensis TaxID=2878561 RepID=UPI001CD991E3|nr:DUF6412 domain-containing protein [Jidongwangia harbinensis]MCA2211306.1 DUF6412 domain-containing protein [Jidongwangia harbinensis]
MTWLEAFWHLVSVLTDAGPTGLLAGAGAVAGVLLGTVVAAGVRLGRRPAAIGPHVTRRVLRERTRRTGVPRHRDPDASGRVRPRGPTRPLAAA